MMSKQNGGDPTVEQLNKRLIAAGNANLVMVGRLERAQETIIFLEKQLQYANQNVAQQKRIVTDHLQQSAEKEKELVEEIQGLKERLRAYGDNC